MFGNLTIEQPFGISVFGSALLRVSPDFATIRAAVTRLEEKPSEAFTKARKGAQAVTSFLPKLKSRNQDSLEFLYPESTGF
jgi:hypothetical protein